uniref:Uncharacterized protein n=1 Tax=Anopheles farauti TaxID=69004 RepID=A0A182Q1X0_9DIPT
MLWMMMMMLLLLLLLLLVLLLLRQMRMIGLLHGPVSRTRGRDVFRSSEATPARALDGILLCGSFVIIIIIIAIITANGERARGPRIDNFLQSSIAAIDCRDDLEGAEGVDRTRARDAHFLGEK